MAIHRFILVLALFAACGPWLQAATHPNFTGTWRLNETASATPTLGVREVVFTIEHNDPKFKYSATGRRAMAPFSEAYEFTTDGKAPQNSGQAGIVGAWDGETLIMKYVKEGKERMRFQFRISPDGKQMTREADLGNNRKIREIYDRQ